MGYGCYQSVLTVGRGLKFRRFGWVVSEMFYEFWEDADKAKESLNILTLLNFSLNLSFHFHCVRLFT
jgi:hypothetical protein